MSPYVPDGLEPSITASGIYFNQPYAHYFYEGEVFGPNHLTSISRDKIGDYPADRVVEAVLFTHKYKNADGTIEERAYTYPGVWSSVKGDTKEPQGFPLTFSNPSATPYWDETAKENGGLDDLEEMIKTILKSHGVIE